MLVTIKPHSCLQKFFETVDIRVDIDRYIDIVEYINAIHPRFTNYIKQQAANEFAEGFVFMDKNFATINVDELAMRKAKNNDVIYIVPAIVGGGGKRGALFALLAVATVAAFAFAAPIGFAVASGLSATGATAGAAATAGLSAGWAALPAWGHSIIIQLGLAAMSSLFLRKKDDGSPESRNDYFGGLTNTIASGTPVGLNYGEMRVAGQMISGYLKTYEKSSTEAEDPTVNSILAA